LIVCKIFINRLIHGWMVILFMSGMMGGARFTPGTLGGGNMFGGVQGGAHSSGGYHAVKEKPLKVSY
jgi:hypothetical protein